MSDSYVISFKAGRLDQHCTEPIFYFGMLAVTVLLGVAPKGAIKRPRCRHNLLSPPATQKRKNTDMSLTAKDKAVVKAFWAKISGKADAIGHEALAR